jgi:hypothetical protein
VSLEMRFLTEQKKNSNKTSQLLKNKRDEIKKKFLDLANQVNCECFPKIFHDGSHILMKLIWAFLFVVFSGLTGYLLRQNVIDYLRHEIFYS